MTKEFKEPREKDNEKGRPNILMIMVDQLSYPGYESGGFHEGIKKILGFKPMTPQEAEEYGAHFPGFMALRKNSVALNNHRIAAAACVPSRTAIFTGQYGTRSGSHQTDGVFKDGAADNFPWLDPTDMPTIGSYLRAAEYSSHYFGKWHISGEATTSLEKYGFSDWELSYPDPHGTLPNNLGYYRDYQFRDLVTSFLRRQGLGVPYDIADAKHNAGLAEEPEIKPKPWFAVSSFANPHDIASYPGLPGRVYDKTLADYSFTLAVPGATPGEADENGDVLSHSARAGSMQLRLNKTGLKQDNASVAPTWDEDIVDNNKPDCHFDYSYKMGLALFAKAGLKAANSLHPKLDRDATLEKAIDFTLKTEELGLPITLTSKPEIASEAFMQYYAYLISEVDQHIKSVLDALEESGQAENTIVLFCADHGEYAAAHHMMTEKWHTGYEEILHVPMVVSFPEGMKDLNTDPQGWDIRQVDTATSHVDILPTILGFAGEDVDTLLETVGTYNHLYRPVGLDLSSLIKTGTDDVVANRDGVLFINYDSITEPLHTKAAEAAFGKGDISAFEVFAKSVERIIKDEGRNFPSETTCLGRGPVVQPGYVHCVVDKEGWKFVRYFDDKDDSVDHQYEMYDLANDPTEQENLLIFNGKFPQLITTIIKPRPDFNYETKAINLMALMVTLEDDMLAKLDNRMTR